MHIARTGSADNSREGEEDGDEEAEEEEEDARAEERARAAAADVEVVRDRLLAGSLRFAVVILGAMLQCCWQASYCNRVRR